jgi:hypothetical protein
MTRDDIFSLLKRILGPLHSHRQDHQSQLDKFEDILKHSLTQSSLEFRRTGVQFPDFQNNISPELREKLQEMTDEIVTAQATRTANDPIFWLRQRNFDFKAGIEENAENFLESRFSFGPFINGQTKETWFDFFQGPKQLRFDVFQGGLPDVLVITLPGGAGLPSAGSHANLNFADCTIWISVKPLAANADKKYVGVRAKNCEITFDGIAAVQTTGFVTILAPTFQLNFEPVDMFEDEAGNNRPAKAKYPRNIVISFTGINWVLQSFARSLINLNGATISLETGVDVSPVYFEQEKLVHFPIPANDDSWEISSNDTERFSLAGKTRFTDPGWYLPVVSADTTLGVDVLGTMMFSGYLGFRGKDGLTFTWPDLENGKLTFSKLLLMVRPGRMNLKYTYDARPRIKQQLQAWKTGSDEHNRSALKIKPLPTGEGNCIADNQRFEALLQSANISATLDRPLYSNQKRANITELTGIVVFVKIKENTSVYTFGSQLLQAGVQNKRRKPQSLCLRNALLTTDDPRTIFVEGNILSKAIISEGYCHLTFPIYRLINTLPDPYISNQNGIFDSIERFNELWRAGQDTLPDQFLFNVTSIVQWNNDAASLKFVLNQRDVTNDSRDHQLLDRFIFSASPCNPEQQRVSTDLEKLASRDPENVIGAYGFLEWLPGNRSLVDVSGSANLWGVSFSDALGENDSVLSESLGYPTRFPFRIKDMDLVSSGRMTRLFTLPHIQWEPVMKIENDLVVENDIPSIINFATNGNPTRIASASKADVELVPTKLYEFILDGFNSNLGRQGVAAHFTLPFGICAFAYFNPRRMPDLPSARATRSEPAFLSKKTGPVNGGMQLHVEANPPSDAEITPTDNHFIYFLGSTTQLAMANSASTILGNKITDSFNNEFSSGPNARVPLERIDFSGYGATIFSKWLNESANFGRVSQVTFDVMIGRTAHEVIQIKSILFPWGVPVVRSIVIQRKNTGIVTRWDSGWVATGPGRFEFLSNAKNVDPEFSPYKFHPGTVTGIYDVREIRDVSEELDIFIPKVNGTRFSGVYFNGDIEIENIVGGALPKTGSEPTGFSRVHSVGQFGYVMLADTGKVNDQTTLGLLFPPAQFKELLNDPKVGGSLGGPVNAVMDIAGSGQRMQLTRVDISASDEANVTFVVSVRGTVELPKEGSWTVAKCLPSKDVSTVNAEEAVPLIRNGILTVRRQGEVVTRKVAHNGSHHSFGDPSEIEKYAINPPVPPSFQYGLLQTTDTQKILFRRPSFSETEAKKLFTDVPDLADAFRLLNCNTIFPNLSKTLSLPGRVEGLLITGGGNGLKFDEGLFSGPDNLTNFVPTQLAAPSGQEFKLIDEGAFKVIIKYGLQPGKPSKFQVDLSSDAAENAANGARKKWETVNKDVAIEVHLGPLKPLLTLRGQFRSEAGKDPEFENPEMELGGALQDVKDILQVLAQLTGKGDVIADSLKVVVGNSPDSWNYKMSIEQRIPVLQFPSTEMMTLTSPPPLIIEASLLLGVFFNLSLSPDPKNLVKPGAGAVLGFEGMIQIQLITIGIAAAYGVGITKVKAFVDLTDPKPQFEFTFGFGGTVVVSLPVVGLVSVTRSFSLTGNIDSGDFLVMAGQMLRGVLSLAGGLLIVAIQIEGKAGVQHSAGNDRTVALFEMIFSLDVGLAFVIKYNFTKRFTEEITLSQLPI